MHNMATNVAQKNSSYSKKNNGGFQRNVGGNFGGGNNSSFGGFNGGFNDGGNYIAIVKFISLLDKELINVIIFLIHPLYLRETTVDGTLLVVLDLAKANIVEECYSMVLTKALDIIVKSLDLILSLLI